MLITVKSSTVAWKSPDGKITIYDIIDQDGNQWQTRSRKIGEGIDQSFDCTTTVSKSNKTYLIQVPDPNSPYFSEQQARVGGQPQPALPIPLAPQQPAAAGLPTATTAQFTNAVDKFVDAVNKLEKLLPNWTTDKLTPSGDVVPTKIDPEAVAEFFGGEILKDDTP